MGKHRPKRDPDVVLKRMDEALLKMSLAIGDLRSVVQDIKSDAESVERPTGEEEAFDG